MHMYVMGRKKLWCSSAKSKNDVQVSIYKAIELKKKRLAEHAAGWRGNGKCEGIYQLGSSISLPTRLCQL